MSQITVIIPTYNGAKTLGRAIESVQSQTFKDFELLIVIDGSTDDSKGVAQKYADSDNRIKIISYEPNRGIQRALSLGLSSATGDYIARIDDDDMWSDMDKLDAQIKFLKENPQYALVGTGLIVNDAKDKEIFRFLNPETDKLIRSKILYRNCFSHSTVLFKKETAILCGGYSQREEAQHIEDYELWLKLGTKGKFANLPRYSVSLTMDSKTISGSNKIAQFSNQLRIIRAFKNSYPKYHLNRIKSSLRISAYIMFGWLIPASLRNLIVKYYKQI